MKPIFYNTQHSPIGAFASFTLGSKGAKGGLGLELAGPANQNVYIGWEKAPGHFSCLPFFEQSADESARFDVESETGKARTQLRPFAEKEISRVLSPGQDQWTAGELTFAIHTPVTSAPDPASATEPVLKLAYAPALAVEMSVDNRRSKTSRRVIFGFQSNDPRRAIHRMESPGIACGESLAIVGCSPGLVPAVGFSAEEILEESHDFNRGFALGSTGLLIGLVPAGKIASFRFAVCFHHSGNATTGLAGNYLYTRFFSTLDSVAGYVRQNFTALKRRGAAFDRRFYRAKLNDSRSFMLAQSIQSYYGSTQLLEVAGKPLWIVNEGEYRMINTFDLMADQVFFETTMNPWTVRNELDWYLDRYSYTDTVRLPGDRQEFPGGLTFTHDMGVANHFTPPGYSAYEKAGLEGCFSHMCHEELVNWVVCGLAYLHKTKDLAWRKKRLPTFGRILASLLNRDHPDPAKRDGVMSLDSSRCAGGAEITTYDSLDVSLGQARNNLYLAVKCWGCYVGMEDLFRKAGDLERSAICRTQSRLAAATICAAAGKDGLLPAILGENVPSRIIPAIEGLIVPFFLGLNDALSPDGPHGALIRTLTRHLRGVLKPGVCLFPDGAWKISSTSNNSWLSKVYLCQFIAEHILHGVPAKALSRADERHQAWLLEPENAYWAWSDQFVSGIARGSKYYPRGVTSILWMNYQK